MILSRAPYRTGMSLIEVIAMVALMALIASAGMMFMQRGGTDANLRACEAHRVVLSNEVRLYEAMVGGLPNASLSDLVSVVRQEEPLPVCPTSQSPYRLHRGFIVCPQHGSDAP